MKNKIRLSMIISLVAAMFILSMFSGVVAAQADDQYKQSMIRYQNTLKKLEDARDKFDKAYSKLRDLRDERSREDLKNITRDYLLSAINHTISHLEVLKTRVEQNGNEGIIPFDASAIIDGHIKELDQIKANVLSAQTMQDFIAANRELKDLWEKIRLETRYYIGIVLNNRIDQFINKTDNVTKSMDAAIKKLKDNGTNTSKLESDEASFKQLVTEARANQAKTVELFKAHTGFDNGILTDANLARDFLKQGDASQRATIKSLKEASKQVLKFVRDFRQISRGEVKIEGTVTSALSGKGE